jgi:hypothetical protein
LKIPLNPPFTTGLSLDFKGMLLMETALFGVDLFGEDLKIVAKAGDILLFKTVPKYLSIGR